MKNLEESEEALKKLLSMPADPKLREEAIEDLKKAGADVSVIRDDAVAYGPWTDYEMRMFVDALIETSDASWFAKKLAKRKIKKLMKVKK